VTAISIILILINFLVSWKGFGDRSFFDSYKFDINAILVGKQYHRIITSGFLHTGWAHLIWNMISLYAFSESVELVLGPLQFLLIYFSSLIGGGLLSSFIHRNHSSYTAVGASGAVSGVIFAAIALFPGIGVGLFLIPVQIPGWVYGLLYVLISIWGIRSRFDNIGHDAHLGGALIGLMVAIAIQPSALEYNLLTILVIAAPCIVFMYILATRPHVLLTNNNFGSSQRKFYSVDHRYNAEKADRQKEVDRILDKIARHGLSSLSRKEKEILDEHSKTLR
jgi:membrane associated rhomboid family serine protease